MLMLSYIFLGLASVSGLTGGVLVDESVAIKESASVEIGLAEMSPRGEAGGFAVPASGCSTPEECGVTFTQVCLPNGNVSIKMHFAYPVWSAYIGNVGGFYFQSPLTVIVPPNTTGNGMISVLSAGYQTMFDNVPGHYHEYPVSVQSMSCSALPNLQSVSVSAPGTVNIGTSANITGIVRNNSNLNITGSFTDGFLYRWGTTGSWTAFGNRPAHATGLNSNQQATDSAGSFTFNQNGTVYFRHCVDWDNDIAESDDSDTDNCSTSAGTVVSGIAPPTVTLTANPTTVPGVGSTTVLTWNVQNATTCTASNGWSGSKTATTGTHQQSGVVVGSDPTTYDITCTGPGGSDSDDAVVTVDDGDIVGEIEPCDDNYVVRQGEEFCMEYEVDDPTQCVVRLGNVEIISSLSNSGQFDWTLNSQGTFILWCGDEIDRAIIRVLPVFQET